MRIVFCGTPEFSVPSLRRLAADPDISIVSVVTQPDRPRGRGGVVVASPVKKAAIEAGLRVEQFESIKGAPARDYFDELAPDAVVIIAYGQIIPAKLLTIPRLGWINVHGSLLPKYRGAAPIQWAIANGEQRTGLTTMQIDAGMDTGPILLQRELVIGTDETTPEMAARMSEAGADLIGETLRKFDRGEIAPIPQDQATASYAPILKKEDGRVDWSRTATQIYARMRGFAPWPGAHSTFRGQPCQLWGHAAAEGSAVARDSGSREFGSVFQVAKDVLVECGEVTLLHLDAVQLEGRKRISAVDFANGARLNTSDRFI